MWGLEKFYSEFWAWSRCLSPLKVKVGLNVLHKPRHVGLGHDNSSPQEVKVGIGSLPEPKHARLRRDSPSS